MEMKILPLLTKDQKQQVVKEVMYQQKGKFMTIILVVLFITGFSVSFAILTNYEYESLKNRIIDHPNVDSVLRDSLIK